MNKKRKPKFIFVTGGVVSSIGKGIAAASIGSLLEMRGLKIALTKMDPYINVDPGTMSPYQHGEVFVTDDGAETDLDLGHYSRFTNAILSKKNSFTAGQIYAQVIQNERKGKYLGGTIQVIPHITDEIKRKVFEASEGVDVSIIEIGGTVGDIEGLPFLEAIRQLRLEFPREDVCFIHVTLIPFIDCSGELKSKPTQHSVQKLREIGLQPNFLICRSQKTISPDLRRKISLFCNVVEGSVIEACDVDNIYKIPLLYHRQGLDDQIVEHLGIWTAAPNMKPWKSFLDRMEYPKQDIQIALIGKYTGLTESYKSVSEALTHGGISQEAKVNIKYINSESLTSENVDKKIAGSSGVLIPGGFGDRGIDGKLIAIEYARKNRVPFLGICLGMQVACIEFAKNVCNIEDATSEELEPKAKDQIIHYMPEQRSITDKGATMRLGSYECHLNKGSVAFKSYGNSKIIHERHRHRYEFNNQYREQFEQKGFIFSGLSPDKKLVEVIEITDHPWFIGCQFHPEFKSSPRNPAPLFVNFIKSALDYNSKSKTSE